MSEPLSAEREAEIRNGSSYQWATDAELIKTLHGDVRTLLAALDAARTQRVAAVAILRDAALFSTASILHERIEEALAAMGADDAKVSA